MKRYLVFMCNGYYPNGTLDLVGKDSISVYGNDFLGRLRGIVCKFLLSNKDVLEGSVLPNAHKFLIEKGEVI